MNLTLEDKINKDLNLFNGFCLQVEDNKVKYLPYDKIRKSNCADEYLFCDSWKSYNTSITLPKDSIIHYSNFGYKTKQNK